MRTKEQEQKIWTSVLEDFGCHAEPVTGNRPCDFGVPCDRCLYDFDMRSEYERRLKEVQ